MNTRKLNRIGRWLCRMAGPLALALLMVTPARADSAVVPLESLPNKPQVTIRGNVVVDEANNPTGFYELALCVRSPRKIVGPTAADTTPHALTETEYAQAQTDIANGVAALAGVDPVNDYTITYYPFSAASAVVGVNADVLSAVSWEPESVEYAQWDATSGVYLDPSDTAYPRGIDTTANADAFPAVTTAKQQKPLPVKVALDAAGAGETFTAAAEVDDYYEDSGSGVKTALITLSAHAPDNAPVVYAETTPVCVIRFSYDLNRFSKDIVKGVNAASTVTDQYTGDGTKGFWLGLDRASSSQVINGTTPLTWLADTATGGFTFSDGKAANTEAGQVVWTRLSNPEWAGTAETWNQTEYYYYLGASQSGSNGTDGSVSVDVSGTVTQVDNVKIPTTQGVKILAAGTTENDPAPAVGTQAQYSYYENILYLNGWELELKLVNDTTFKKATGGTGGTTILFYDWDDTLIGSLIVGKGDQRAVVNEYVESTMVHPELRASQYLNNGALPAAGSADEASLKNLTDSLDRDYTYRGKYNSNVNGTGVVRADDDSATASWANNDPNTPGSEYPLTNKLDYAFYRHVDTVTTVETPTGTPGYTQTQRYVTSEPLSAYPDAQLYPYVYGWAVVEQESDRNDRNWQVRRDATELENTWTTMGVGELKGLDPSYDLAADLKGQSVPTAAPSGGSLTTSYPAFLTAPATAPTTYSYLLEGDSGYLKMADFSDVESMLTRAGQDTIVVKAVYEEGTSLMDGSHYTLITEPAYSKWNPQAADSGGAYRVQLTLERSYDNNGVIQGTTRLRDPAVRQDATVDYKWITDTNKGVSNDLDNATLLTARGLTQTSYTSAFIDVDNGEEITFSFALSARYNRIDYKLIEKYGYNFVTGTQRSLANSDRYYSNDAWFVEDNYHYLNSDSNLTDDYYDCDFATREGSRGFVLYGTLGHFLEQATLCNHGEVARTDYNLAVYYNIAKDANLRMDLSGTQPVYADNTLIQEAFLAAARACENHKGDAAYDCWDENLDCARLTYHQAQWFLLDYQSNPGADILKVTEAEDAGHKLTFCHYHVSCTGGHVPKAPTTWKDLMDTLHTYNTAAAGSDDKKNAQADLNALDLSALETLTSLRADGSGAKYSDKSTMISALAAAESALSGAGQTTSWSSMQYVLLGGAATTAEADMKTAAQENYWWYDGATTAPRVNDWAGMVTAVETAHTDTALKDGTTTDFQPRSALSQAVFPADATAYLANATTTRVQRAAWVKLTDNLVPSHSETLNDPDGSVAGGTGENGDESWDYDYGKFSDGNALRYYIVAASDAIYDDVDAGTMPALPADADAWWEEIQTRILRDTSVYAAADPGDNLGDNLNDLANLFWWRGGSTPFKVTNLSTLAECVRILQDNTDARYDAAVKEWQRLTVADIESAAISGSLRWKRDDGASGDGKDMYPYTGDATRGDAIFESLAASDAKTEILTQLTSAVNRFDAAQVSDPTLSLTWERVQYLILNSGDLPAGSAVADQARYYWWQGGNTTGNAVTLTKDATETKLDNNLKTLLQATYRAAFKDPGTLQSIVDLVNGDGGGSFLTFTKLTTAYNKGSYFARDSAYGTKDATEQTTYNPNDTYAGPDTLSDLTPYPGSTAQEVTDFLDVLAGFRDAAKTDQGKSLTAYDLPDFNWQQVQYYILNGTYLSYTDQIIIDLRDKTKAQPGDYWWYYGAERTPPERPGPAVTDEALRDWVTANLASDAAITAITKDGFNGLTDLCFKTTVAAGQASAVTIRNVRTRLKTLVAAIPSGKTIDDLTWYQIQVAIWPANAGGTGIGNGSYVDPATAVTAYKNSITAADWRPDWVKDYYDETTGLAKS